MPSFRVTMTIGALRPGMAPESVLSTAKAAAVEVATLEASGIDVVAGSARVTVRFTADDPELAGQVARHIAARTDAAAEVVAWAATERVHGRWLSV